MRIGQVATQAGVNAQTLRYYERRGLLDSPRRTRSGYREYDEGVVAQVVFIKRAQELGFTLGEVQELLALRQSDGPCVTVRAAAEAKVGDIDSKLKNLRAMKRALLRLIESCDADGTDLRCPIIEALNRR